MFATSAAVLVLEILAGRLLAPYVGVSIETYTGIIGTILAGIAVGAWAGGVLADKVDPRGLLPLLLIAGGALALAIIPVVRLLGNALSGGGGGTILLLSAAGFLPSAAVLSAVPPAVIKLQLQNLDETGATVGQLSAWSTAGAIFGTFFTGFVLVSSAAVSTLIVATALALIVGGLALGVFDGSSSAPFAGQGTALASVAALAVVSTISVASVNSPCGTQTSYYCLSVVAEADDDRQRVLVLDNLRHSFVDLDDPTLLSFWYVRRLVDAIELAPAADDIVYIGGGALTIPRYVRATAPGTNQIVLEIDGELIEVVEKQMGLDRSQPETIDIRVGDARLAFADLGDDTADVIIGDAFGSRSVPFHLATEEFLADVARVLRPHGMYAANIIDAGGQRFVAAEAATLARVFDHVVVVRNEAMTSGLGGNAVIIASDVPLDSAALAARLRQSGDGGELVSDLSRYVAAADVLTDDFAPVDQLIALGT